MSKRLSHLHDLDFPVIRLQQTYCDAAVGQIRRPDIFAAPR